MDLQKPRTSAEVQDIVGRSSRVRALGTRHSFNDLADTSGSLISLVGLPAEPVIDRVRSTVTIGAGTRFGNVAAYLEANSLALHNLGSLPHISVAGACATGTHGSGDSNGSLSTAVAGLEIVAGSGEIRQVRRGDPEFEGMVVSLGALGVITRIELDVQPSYRVRQDAYVGLPWSRLLAETEAIFQAGYSVSVFTDWLGDSVGLTLIKSKLGDDDRFGPPAVVADLELAPATSLPTNWTPLGTVGPWNERLSHFRMGSTPSNGDEIQTEYFVDRVHSEAALLAVRSLRNEIAPLLHESELRSVAGDGLWLSPTRGTDSLAIHFTWRNKPKEIAGLLAALEEVLEPFAPRPHWGKWFRMSHAQVNPMYPRLKDFASLSNRLDPEQKFRNSYLERVLALPNDQPKAAFH